MRSGVICLLGFGLWLTGAESPVLAAPGNGPGATSRGSIAISVSVRPRARAAVPLSLDGPASAPSWSAAGNRQLCLRTNYPAGTYTLALEARQGSPRVVLPSAAAGCRSVEGRMAPGADAAFEFPAMLSRQSGPVTVIVAPD